MSRETPPPALSPRLWQLLEIPVQFGAPQLQRLSGGGALFTQVTIPGLDAGSAAAGAPALPVWRQLVAVPRGARARISSVRPVVSDRFPATLYPFQPFAGESPSTSTSSWTSRRRTTPTQALRSPSIRGQTRSAVRSPSTRHGNPRASGSGPSGKAPLRPCVTSVGC